MVAASSSWEYDVFLNFRGEDTRRSFTSHLYDVLSQRGIHVFLDDEGIKRGDKLSPTLLEAIEGSRISIVIFSENYANSKWCLKELDKIIECSITRGQIVLPIFYNVDPSDVRNQTEKYKTAFVQHEEKYGPSLVQKWREALRDAADLAGWDSRNTRSDRELIKVVVEDVSQKLQTDMAVDYAGGNLLDLNEDVLPELQIDMSVDSTGGNPLDLKVPGSYLRKGCESALPILKKGFVEFFRLIICLVLLILVFILMVFLMNYILVPIVKHFDSYPLKNLRDQMRSKLILRNQNYN